MTSTSRLRGTRRFSVEATDIRSNEVSSPSGGEGASLGCFRPSFNGFDLPLGGSELSLFDGSSLPLYGSPLLDGSYSLFDGSYSLFDGSYSLFGGSSLFDGSCILSGDSGLALLSEHDGKCDHESGPLPIRCDDTIASQTFSDADTDNGSALLSPAYALARSHSIADLSVLCDSPPSISLHISPLGSGASPTPDIRPSPDNSLEGLNPSSSLHTPPTEGLRITLPSSIVSLTHEAVIAGDTPDPEIPQCWGAGS
ncbi:hypothetical protein C8Q79DRAFT_1011494 [Trametes meyenii]|nr:hypothetical protein C8Q79DRAFT_1011494 [Trametes meyenii]